MTIEKSNFGTLEEYWTGMGCRVIRIRSISRKHYRESAEDEVTSTLLTPVEHIFLSVPEKEEIILDKPNEGMV